MEAPIYRLDQRVVDRRDHSIKGTIIAIFTHNTPVPPKVTQPPYANVWRYLVLLDDQRVVTQMWESEENIKEEKDGA